MQTCYFGNFGNAWPSPSKFYYQSVASFHAYLCAKNQLCHLILKILQRNSKVVILGNLGMLGHTRLNDNSSLKKPLKFICSQKIKFVLHAFPEILQRYCKLIVLDTLGMPGYTNPNWYYQLVENFRVYLEAKNQLHSNAFLEILQRYADFLFRVLWACLVAHTQNDSINL